MGTVEVMWILRCVCVQCNVLTSSTVCKENQPTRQACSNHRGHRGHVLSVFFSLPVRLTWSIKVTTAKTNRHLTL